MLATPALPFVYGRQGGSAPPSFELLSVRRDGTARYVAGNPWPAQPPFDEIGSYEWPVPSQTSRQLLALAADARSGNRYFDTGLEYVDAWAEGRWYEAEWDPSGPPAASSALIDAVRSVIAEGRKNPASILRARLELPADGDEVAVVLSSGKRGFRLGGHGAGSDGPLIRLRATRNSETGEPSAIPTQLASVEPVRPGGGLDPANPDGTFDLAPGSSVRLLVPRPRPRLRQAERVRLEALIQLEFPLTSLTGEDYLQPGWLVPEPVWIPGQRYG